jgi:hypothetical protein
MLHVLLMADTRQLPIRAKKLRKAWRLAGPCIARGQGAVGILPSGGMQWRPAKGIKWAPAAGHTGRCDRAFSIRLKGVIIMPCEAGM